MEISQITHIEITKVSFVFLETYYFAILPDRRNSDSIRPWHGTYSNESVDISWPSLDGNIENDLLKYYGYSIQYRIQNEGSWLIQNVTAKGSFSNYTYQIDGLHFNTVYEVQVSPYRQIGDRREIRNSTQIMTVKTACRGKDNIVLLCSFFSPQRFQG